MITDNRNKIGGEMDMTTDMLESILAHLEKMAKAQTVIGEPVQIGDKTVVPIVKMGLGFGAGGGTNSKDGMNSGGGGGGLGINPAGFIVIEGEKVSFLPVKPTNVTALTDMIPNIIEKLTNLKKKGCCKDDKCCCSDDKCKCGDEIDAEFVEEQAQ